MSRWAGSDVWGTVASCMGAVFMKKLVMARPVPVIIRMSHCPRAPTSGRLGVICQCWFTKLLVSHVGYQGGNTSGATWVVVPSADGPG